MCIRDSGKEPGVNGVHRGEIADVLQQDGGLDHVAERIAALFEDVAQVRKRPVRLGFDAFVHFAGGAVDRELPRNIECAAGFDGLRVGSHGFGRMGRCDNLLHNGYFSNFTQRYDLFPIFAQHI